jgi:hypothetical protein
MAENLMGVIQGVYANGAMGEGASERRVMGK